LIPDLAESLARLLAIAMLEQHPEEVFEKFPFDGQEINAGADEEIEIVFRRRKKPMDTERRLACFPDALVGD